jgi:hypothetical protein
VRLRLYLGLVREIHHERTVDGCDAQLWRKARPMVVRFKEYSGQYSSPINPFMMAGMSADGEKY